MALRHCNTTDENFFTDCCGIYRHDRHMVNRVGTYICIPILDAAEFIQFARLSEMSGWETHPTCVVDDFGSLVKVPA